MTLWFLCIITLAKEQVNHCRLRLLDDPVCSCGYTAETYEDFLLHCPLYNSIRNKTFNKIDESERNINTLLFGSNQLHLEKNNKMFAIVHEFVCQTDRLQIFKSLLKCVCDTSEEVLPPPPPPHPSVRPIITITSLDHSISCSLFL